MNIGILILFHNDEKEIETLKFISLLDKKINLNICLVNNGSTDKTLEMLKEIQKKSSVPISIVDMKKHRDHHAAIKAGFRYLSCKQEFPNILCLKYYKLHNYEILKNVLQMMK